MLQILKKQKVVFGNGSQAEVIQSKFENGQYEITFVSNGKPVTRKFGEEVIFFLDTDEAGTTLWLIDCMPNGRKTNVIKRINRHWNERLSN